MTTEAKESDTLVETGKERALSFLILNNMAFNSAYFTFSPTFHKGYKRYKYTAYN
jgi:hypothetical protein